MINIKKINYIKIKNLRNKFKNKLINRNFYKFLQKKLK